MTIRSFVRTSALSLGLAAALGGCDSGADNQAPADMAMPAGDLAMPSAVTVLSQGFMTPECAYWDAGTMSWYVSSINGTSGMRDGNGFITRISADLQTVDHDWATGLDSPFGMRAVNGKLYVADIDQIVEIDLANPTLRTRQTVAVATGGFLNDIAAAAGTPPVIYASETVANRVWSWSPGGAAPRINVTNTAFKNANGLLVDGARLMQAGLGDFMDQTDMANIWAITPGTGVAMGTATAFGSVVGRFDGIEKDGSTLLLSDFAKRSVIRVDATTGAALGTVRDLTQDGFMTAADFGFDPVTRRIAVPDLRGNKVAFFTATAN